ncbi:WD40 repeat [Fusarium albosuccineum]|uniref:Mitochondrial division protein 1 n=1 Tax=Fusarium albosuccineum TaxID=1237068 RepID=A0A8H4LAE4_9HYPO|nr:WD40 repeat [Fusarium albosuccineum]
MANTSIHVGKAANVAQVLNVSSQTNFVIDNQGYQAIDNQCMRDLRETDPRHDKTRIQDMKGGLLWESYRWILDNSTFQQWLNGPQSKVLWIQGDPGKGKTMLLCGIIDQLKNPDNRLSYFFCQATEARLSSATAVLRGLIYILASEQPGLLSHIRKEYNHAGKQLFEDGNAWQALSKILHGMLNTLTSDRVILIVDALDECTTNRHQLLDFITQHSSVRWIVSSRNWLDISRKLDNAGPVVVKLRLESVTNSISEAIHTYIGSKTNELTRVMGYDEKTRNTVEKYLICNAADTFLWVSLVCQELADPSLLSLNILDRLKAFPPGLDALYGRMIRHIYGSSHANLCKEVLATVSIVYRPITLEELLVFLGQQHFNRKCLEEIVASCGSLLTLREGVIYFVHQSAKDYLLDKAFDDILPSGDKHHHYAIFSRSLGTMLNTLRRDPYDLRVPGFPTDQILSPDPDPLASIRYSCVYWVDHLDDSTPETRTNDHGLQDGGMVHDFLTKKYLYWLEALSILCRVVEGVSAVQKLEVLARLKEAPELAKLLRDARRFVLSHKSAIEVAPLQVYASALVFSPTRSVVKELFKEEAPRWIVSATRMEPDWTACLQTIEGHDSSVTVNSVAFSTNGQWLASGSDKVTIWSPFTGACLQTLEGHQDSITAVAFSCNDRSLASGSRDGTIRIWDPAKDCSRLASGSFEGTAKIWEATSTASTCLKTLDGQIRNIISVAFLSDGDKLVSVSWRGEMQIWDLPTGRLKSTCTVRCGPLMIDTAARPLPPRGIYRRKTKLHYIDTAAIAADRVAIGTSVGTLGIWDPATGECLRELENRSRYRYSSAAFSADGTLASGSWDGKIKIWNPDTGMQLQMLEGYGLKVSSLAFSSNSMQLASGSDDNTIRIWDLTQDMDLKTTNGGEKRVTSVTPLPNDLWLSTDLGNVKKIWDSNTGECLRVFLSRGQPWNNLALSSDGTHLQTFKGHRSQIKSMAFSSDNTLLASGSEDHTVKIWNSATGECLQTLGEDYDESVHRVAFSPDDSQLASVFRDGTTRIWNLYMDNRLQTIEKDDRAISALAFSPDDTMLASASSDSSVKIWDFTTGMCLHTIAGNTKQVSWDPANGSCLHTDFGDFDVPDSGTGIGNQQSTTGPLLTGFGISSDGVWVLRQQLPILWLPPEHRPYASSICKDALAIGYNYGRREQE